MSVSDPRSDLPRIFDCFTVNDELDLLEFRLSYLSDVVDEFVIVEADVTFRGTPKPLHVRSARRRFARWADRMTIVTVDDMPSEGDAWARERHQHAAIRRGLGAVLADDIVIVGDLDEVPYQTVVQSLPTTLVRPTRLVLRHALHYVNFEVPQPWTDGPKACRGRDLDDVAEMGNLLGHPEGVWAPGGAQALAAAGWHLSYLGGSAATEGKLRAFSHAELDAGGISDAIHRERCRAHGIDLRGDHLLSRLPAHSLDDLQRSLLEVMPAALAEFPLPPRAVRRRFRAYAHLRQEHRLPAAIIAAIDRHPRVLAVLGPFLLILDAGLIAARKARLRSRTSAWFRR